MSSKIEEMKKERKAAIEAMPKKEDYASTLSWIRQLTGFYYKNKHVQDTWLEVMKASGESDLVDETLNTVLTSSTVEGTEGDSKAFSRTVNNGIFLYHSDFVRMLNCILKGALK